MPLPENLSPIFISSPLGRSGTTLLQRLICSSDNGICYGESLAQDFLNYFEYFRSACKDSKLARSRMPNTGKPF